MTSIYDDNNHIRPLAVVIVIFVGLGLLLTLILGCWLGFGVVSRWNKERTIATNRRDIVITAEAEAEAQEARTVSEVEQAERLAERDRIRAQGQADANGILQDSLTPEYLIWTWLDGVRQSDAQLIYVPVDPATGLPTLPVTEAGRAVTQPSE